MEPPPDAGDAWAAFRASAAPDEATALRAARLEVLRLSGLFDAAWHDARHPGTAGLEAYHDQGWRLGQWPNPYFDPGWYRDSYPDVAQGGQDPLLHYVSYGEAEGRWPVAWFDPGFYARAHAVPPGMHALRHFLLHRSSGEVRAIPEFDPGFYLRAAPDVAACGMDPMEHYLVQGFREGRDPSAAFDTRFYRARYLPGQPDENPLLHYLRHRGGGRVQGRLPAGQTTLAREHRRFTGPGAGFEAVKAQPAADEDAPLVLAFYLPQYHRLAENDAWWGLGFTEWTNLGRGLPRFAGHYQPRIPRDLGHYDLDDPQVLARQVALAQGAGIGGFVWYFYWFDGRRLLERPLERMLADRSVTFPFCLMWANENWTRRWDGSEQDVLVAQNYRREDEAGLLACFARHFADPRYIRLQGRPVLMIYRADAVPRAKASFARWRARLRAVHGEDPILVMAQSFGAEDPTALGLDAAMEFPPHGLAARLPLINDRLELLDEQFAGHVRDYEALVTASLTAPPPDFPLLRCALPGWDNDARRPGRGALLHGATPAGFERWMRGLLAQAAVRPFFGRPMLCINAWNEWAEGAYLEPDRHFGGAFLNAAARAIAGGLPVEPGAELLLVGHDAFAAGAQLLLLHLGRQLAAAHGARVRFLLLAGGSLEAAYRQAGPVTIVPSGDVADRWVGGARAALVNSACCAGLVPGLVARGVRVVLLVHEMAQLLAERGLVDDLRVAMGQAACTLLPADAVAASVRCALGGLPGTWRVLPQGLYRPVAPAEEAVDEAAAEAGRALRAAWGVPAGAVLGLGLGHGDLRKGFDLFLDVFGHAGGAVHMAWVGTVDPALAGRLAAPLQAAMATGRFHLPGWLDDPAPALAAADRLLLTSREDPYPSVVLEALAAGVAVTGFAGSGGVVALLYGPAGCCVAMGDCAAMADTLAQKVAPRRPLLEGHDFGGYAAALLRLACPGVQRISVVLPVFDNARLLAARLACVFAQDMPVAELVLHDDGSGDGGAAVAGRLAAAAGRELRIVRHAANSGSPFGRWAQAVDEAHGELVWIAEADDGCAPDFLSRLAPLFDDPAMLFAYAGSVPVGPDGAELDALSDMYRSGPDEVMEARAFLEQRMAVRNALFNVSAVVFRRRVLLAALRRIGPGLARWQVAGDWRVYVEILGGTGRVGQVQAVLNRHCRAGGSASARVKAAAHLGEISRMHRLIRRRLGDEAGLRARQAQALDAARAFLGG